MEFFKGFSFDNFWHDPYYSRKYMGGEVADVLIGEIEKELGYKLPKSYIWLMKQHNGGIPFNVCYPMEEETSWAEDHIEITGIMGIDKKGTYTLCGELGSKFMMEEWGYPDIGVMICDTPTAGHTMVMLDYRKCGKEGEPEVVFVDQEDDYKITFVAKDFETFIMGLKNAEEFD